MADAAVDALNALNGENFEVIQAGVFGKFKISLKPTQVVFDIHKLVLHFRGGIWCF